MDLAAHQRSMLSLIRNGNRGGPDDDAYLRRVSESGDLKEARRNIFLWRIYVLERTCVLTFALLGQLHLLDESVADFIAHHNISPFRETQGPAFLEGLSGHREPLIASVARFELALSRVRQGDPRRHVVPWSVDPRPVLNALARGLPVDVEADACACRILVSRDLPFLFEVVFSPAEERV